MRPPKGIEPGVHKALLAAGWTHTWSKKCHNRYVPPKGGVGPDGKKLPLLFMASSPSTQRTKYETKTLLKRFGVTI